MEHTNNANNIQYHVECCLEIIRERGEGCINNFPYFLDLCKTYPVCLLAVRYNPMNLQHVPEHHKTLEICSLACSADTRAIEFVPHALVQHMGFRPRFAEQMV